MTAHWFRVIRRILNGWYMDQRQHRLFLRGVYMHVIILIISAALMMTILFLGGNYAASALKTYMDAPYICGTFVWTGFDYIGGTQLFNFPKQIKLFRNSRFGRIPPKIYFICISQDGHLSRWFTSCHIGTGLPVILWRYGSILIASRWNCSWMVFLGKKLQTAIGGKYQFEYFGSLRFRHVEGCRIWFCWECDCIRYHGHSCRWS